MGSFEPDLEIEGCDVGAVVEVTGFVSCIEISLFLSNEDDLPVLDLLSLSVRRDSLALSDRPSFL